MGSLFFGTEFPSQTNDIYIVTQKFLDHISTKDNIRTFPPELNTVSVEAMVFLYYLSIYVFFYNIYLLARNSKP